MYRRWNHLRTVNPHLTTIIAIGGWNEGSDKYSRMASNPSTRKTFVDSVVKFLQKYEFDGLDVDWYFIYLNYLKFIPISCSNQFECLGKKNHILIDFSAEMAQLFFQITYKLSQ